jgi:hypothetical protein
MFEQNTEKSIKACFETYGQHFESYKQWKKYLLDHTRKPFHCLVYVEDGESMEEKYFEYKAPCHIPDVTFKF